MDANAGLPMAEPIFLNIWSAIFVV